nr:zinc finger, CCHC-type [Tanacetum cinerariifolium]
MVEVSRVGKENLVESRECLKFRNDDFIQRGHILNVIPDPLFDVYQYNPSAKELWKALEERFFTEDATSKKFIVFNLTYNTGRYLAQNKYAKVIGNLMYAMTCTRPDIVYVVGRLSRHTNSLGKEHWDAVNRVFKYLKKTMDYGLEYSRDPFVLEGYTNVSWITDQDDYVYISEYGSEAASYELKGLALKQSEKPSYRPKASFNGSTQSGLNEREEGYA